MVTDPIELERRRRLVDRAQGVASAPQPAAAAREAKPQPRPRSPLAAALSRFQRVVDPDAVSSDSAAAADCPPCPPSPACVSSSRATPAGDREPSAPAGVDAPPKEKKKPEREALTSNPRVLAHHRKRVHLARLALFRANEHVRKGLESSLVVPREVHQLCHAICDDTNAVAGALDWIRRTHGPGVALEVEAASLYRARVRIPQPLGAQRDDWSAARARRKLALLTFCLMAPHVLPRSAVTGSTSNEDMLVTAGVPQSLLVLLLRSAQRDPYHPRTLQRDLAQIDECTDLLLRWRTPVPHAQVWERGGNEYGVVNRYCVRAGMVREQWRRARDASEAAIKQAMLRVASWMVWRPQPGRGSPVVMGVGGLMVPAPS